MGSQDRDSQDFDRDVAPILVSAVRVATVVLIRKQVSICPTDRERSRVASQVRRSNRESWRRVSYGSKFNRIICPRRNDFRPKRRSKSRIGLQREPNGEPRRLIPFGFPLNIERVSIGGRSNLFKQRNRLGAIQTARHAIRLIISLTSD